MADGRGALTVQVLGAGDSASALLGAANGRCTGVPVTRTLAAFHAARSKHLPAARMPKPSENLELYPRWLVPARA